MDIDNAGGDSVTVPITIDAVKNVDTYRMTRCTYFSIENSDPAPGWSLSLDNVNIQFIMVGLSGVVTAPPGEKTRFDTLDEIDRLFETIEQNDVLYVESSDIWLPNELFYRLGREPKRGDVYRIGYELFRMAYVTREEVLTDEEFLMKMKNMEVPKILEFSESETFFLEQWNRRQIKINQDLYHDNPDKKLLKKNDQTPTQTK